MILRVFVQKRDVIVVVAIYAQVYLNNLWVLKISYSLILLRFFNDVG